MIIQHRHSSALVPPDQLVIACVVIGAVLGSHTGFASFGTAIPGTVPGALVGLFIAQMMIQRRNA